MKLTKYNSMSKPLKSVLWFTFANFFQKGIAFLLIPFFTRLMTPDQYGQYSVFQSWYSILAIVATLSLGKNVFQKGMIQFEEAKDSFTASMVGLGTLSTLIFFFVYLINPSFWNGITGLSTELMIVMFVELFLLSGFECWCAQKRFDFDYKGVVALSLLISSLTAVVSVPAVYYATSINAAWGGTAAIVSKVLVASCFYLIPFILVLKKSLKACDIKYWRFAILFNLPIIVHLLSSVLLQNSDRIMISQLCGDYEAGIYSIAYSMAMILQIVTASINSSLTPWTFKAIKSQNLIVIKKIGTSYILILSLAILTFISISPEIMIFATSEEYINAIYIIPPVACSVLFMAAQDLFLNIEYYYSKTRLIMIATLIASVANIGLNFVLIPFFGYLAAGYTTLLCYILLWTAHYVAYKSICKAQKISNFYRIDHMLIMLAVTTLCSISLLLLYPYPLVRYFAVIAIALCLILKKDALLSMVRSIKQPD